MIVALVMGRPPAEGAIRTWLILGGSKFGAGAFGMGTK
jgi:hypothetical protein